MSVMRINEQLQKHGAPVATSQLFRQGILEKLVLAWDAFVARNARNPTSVVMIYLFQKMG